MVERVSATRIKMQLDARTVITVNSEEAMKQWLSRYPGAKILSR